VRPEIVHLQYLLAETLEQTAEDLLSHARAGVSDATADLQALKEVTHEYIYCAPGRE
jgi:hypothetical protein